MIFENFFFNFLLMNISPTSVRKSGAALVRKTQHSSSVNRKLVESVQTVVSGV